MLGTYSTLDCPTGSDKIIKEAFDFLKEEFEKIDGTVRKVINPHDLGSYPSFEIDYPFELENIEDDDGEITDENEAKMDEWNEKAAAIEEKYSKKFESNL
jgi:hypothetical protein